MEPIPRATRSLPVAPPTGRKTRSPTGRSRTNLRAGSWCVDLRRLVARGLTDVACAAELSRLLGRPVSRAQVRYWRDPRADPRDRARTLQTREGWGYLLPAYPLSGAEVCVLNCLCDHGPLTGRQLAARLGLARPESLHRWQRDRAVNLLARLVRHGLLSRRKPPNRAPVYDVGPLACPLPLIYGVEKFHGRVRPRHGPPPER